MQVRKFEAKTMQEALNMVKRQLGPEAIILAAKDNTKGFGLGGESSVEVTAAVSANKLREHEYAMSRLRDLEREKILNSSASAQKKFVEKSVNRFREDERPRASSMRYASIMDEEEIVAPVSVSRGRSESISNTTTSASYAQQGNIARMKSLLSGSAKAKQNYASVPEENTQVPVQNMSTATERVKQATQSAFKAFNEEWAEEKEINKKVLGRQKEQSGANTEVSELKDQIAQLQKVIASFREMPQSFLGSHPGAKYDIPFELSAGFERLTKKGMEDKYAAELILQVKQNLDPQKWERKGLIDAFVARLIMNKTKVSGKIDNGLHVFVGASASGKTSTLIKCASRLVVRDRKKVAIITTDTHKLGASEQLRIYARILNVPFAIVRNSTDWSQVLNELSDMDCILVDTPGFSLKNMEELEWIKRAIPNSKLATPMVHYVQSVSMKNIDAKESFNKFNVFEISDIIFTKLDESVQHGLIYNLAMESQLPTLAFSTGPNVPEDFEFASSERVVDLMFDLSKAGN